MISSPVSIQESTMAPPDVGFIAGSQPPVSSEMRRSAQVSAARAVTSSRNAADLAPRTTSTTMRGCPSLAIDLEQSTRFMRE